MVTQDLKKFTTPIFPFTAIVGMGQVRFLACMIQLERYAQLCEVGGAVGDT